MAADSSHGESPTFATAEPSVSAPGQQYADYVSIYGGIGGALVPPGASLETALESGGTLDGRQKNAMLDANHLRLVAKSPPASFLRVAAAAPKTPGFKQRRTASAVLKEPLKETKPPKLPRYAYQELLQKLQTQELFEKFMAQTKEQDLFHVVFDSEVAQNFRPRMARKGKDSEVAAKLEKKGYTNFIDKNYTEAMRYYNQAALVAPSKSDLLGMIYCHRSAVSFLWGDYENCLDDINRALAFTLPEQSRKRLEFRKAKCEILLRIAPLEAGSNDDTDATEVEGEDGANRDAHKFEQVSGRSNAESPGVVSSSRLEAIRAHKLAMQALPPKLTGGPSTKVATASNRLDCTFSEENGRHYIAAVNIEPGDILAVEEPYCKICIPNFWKTHCQHCLKRCEIVIPCSSCSLVCFCSERCQDSATVYHTIECSHILDLRIIGENSGTLLAYRMFTQEGVEFFKKWAPVLSQIESFAKNNLIFGHKTKVRNFPAVYTTLTHVWEKNPMVSFRAAAAAAYLVKSLEEASYFAKSPGKKEDDKRYIGQLLFHCIMAVSSNFFSLPENQPLRTMADITTVPEVGSGFFPNASFFNHSCFPEAMHYFVGNNIVCRALLPVDQGSEVHISYGKYFYCDSKSERQAWLGTNYYFNCTCSPCNQDWPTFNELSDERKLKCPICETSHEDVENHFAGDDEESRYLHQQWRTRVAAIDSLERKFYKIKKKVDRGADLSTIARAIPACLDYMKALFELYECPNKSFLHLYDFVGDLYQLEPYSKSL